MRAQGLNGAVFGIVPLVCASLFFGVELRSQTASNKPVKIFAQKVVEETVAAHPELAGLEIATTPPNKTKCVTIAATEQKEIGGKCDKDEFTAMKTNQPFVEKEKEHGNEVYDVTVPIHDAGGKTIGTAGMDFKPKPQQEQTTVVNQAQEIAKELESKIQSKERLFEPASTK